MRKHITDAVPHDRILQADFPHLRVGRGGLDEPPGVHQFHQVVVNRHRSVQNLAGAGIGPRRAHGIGRPRRRVTDTVVADVVGIELGVVLREIPGDDRILESDALEGLLPHLHALTDVGPPVFGEGIVDVKDDRPDGFDLLAAEPGRRVGGLDPPARRALDAVLHREDAALLGVEIVREVGVLGGVDRAFAPGADLLRHPGDDSLRLRRAQGTGDKVVLHVDNH